MTDRYRQLARYNAWANGRLYDAAAALPDADYRADRGAAFGSVHGTLNHLLVADRIWMRRFTGEGEMPAALDTILYDDLPALRRARDAEDARIIAYADRLDEPALAGRFSYTRATTPERFEQELTSALDHLFNHHTHHRGQIHAMLTGLTGGAPSLDLLLFHRDAGLGGIRKIA